MIQYNNKLVPSANSSWLSLSLNWFCTVLGHRLNTYLLIKFCTTRVQQKLHELALTPF